MGTIILESVVIFILLIPGLLCRKFYLTSEYSRRFIVRKPVEDMIWSIIPALIIHSICVLVINNCSFYSVNIEELASLFDSKNNNAFVTLIGGSTDYILEIIIYFFVACVLSYILGNAARDFIRICKLDIHNRIFRFSDIWNYTFSGESLFFDKKEPGFDLEQIEIKMIGILQDSENLSVIYKGALGKYRLKSNGDLEYIALLGAKRKAFQHRNDNIQHTFGTVPSTKLYFPADKINNLNISYLGINPKEQYNATDSFPRRHWKVARQIYNNDDYRYLSKRFHVLGIISIILIVFNFNFWLVLPIIIVFASSVICSIQLGKRHRYLLRYREILLRIYHERIRLDRYKERYKLIVLRKATSIQHTD